MLLCSAPSPGSPQGSQHGLQRSANGIWGPGKGPACHPCSPLHSELCTGTAGAQHCRLCSPAGSLLCSAGWSRLPSEPPAALQACSSPSRSQQLLDPPGRVYFCVFLSSSSHLTGADSEGWPSSVWTWPCVTQERLGPRCPHQPDVTCPVMRERLGLSFLGLPSFPVPPADGRNWRRQLRCQG